MDVGADIDPDGEERQHLDTCLDCGKTRLWVHRWDYRKEITGPEEHWAKKWSESPFGI